jgi:predicted SAM-dependent methyltransferase
MKLHLGCGQKYLDGYINIDYPQENHTVQSQVIADRIADIRKLQFNRGQVSEIRLHHVFEHFSRVEVCLLLSAWNSWLSKAGIIRIEVPDFYRMILKMINPLSSNRNKAHRHIFGSQEAHWAVHFDGYDAKKLTHLCHLFGFKIMKVNHNHWRGTHNIEIIAQKFRSLDMNECRVASRNYLQTFLVDVSDSEKKLLNIWLKSWEKDIKNIYAKS